MISEIIMKHLWDKGQMWPLFAMTAAYTMNTFALEALSGLSPFQLVFLRDPTNLTSLSFPKIDSIPVKHREYYNLLLARAQLVVHDPGSRNCAMFVRYICTQYQ